MSMKKDASVKRMRLVVARMAKEIVCEVHGIPHAMMIGNARGGSHLAQSRQVAMYLAHVVGQLTLSEVADSFKKNRTTVSHACTAIENRRDSPLFDLELDYMEKRLRQRITEFHEFSAQRQRKLAKRRLFIGER